MADRAYSLLEVKAVDDEERVIRGVATTPTPDRMNDIVEPMGVQFRNPLALLHQHDHNRPIGTVTFDKPTKAGITFTARIPKIAEAGPLKDRVDTAWGEVKAGLIRAVSIGYRTLERAFLENGGVHLIKTEVVELSLVTVPAQAEATITSVKSIDTKLRAASGREQRGDTIGASAGPVKIHQRTGSPMAKKSIAEQISAFEATREEKAARMTSIMEDASEKGETLDAEAQDEFDDVEREIQALDAHIKRLRSMERAQIASAKAVDGSSVEAGAASRGTVPAQVKAAPVEKGIRFARYARCIGLAAKHRRDVTTVADSLYGQRDPQVVTAIKAAVGAVNTTTDAALIGNEGGFADFIDYLRPRTIVGRFGVDGIPALREVPFRVPLIRQVTASEAYWVAEGAAKPLTKPSWDRFELAPVKLAAIAVATMETLEDSSPAAERMLRDDLSAGIIAATDRAFIDPANGGTPGAKPAAITNGIAAIASTGGDADAIREDARLAMAAFITADNPLSSGVWVMSQLTALGLSMTRNALGQREFPDITMNGGIFEGLPVITSQYVGDSVTLLNADDIYWADTGDVTVDMSTEASLEMADNPTGSSITPTPAQLVSMFQTNSAAFRAERRLNWARRRDTAVQVITGATWGQPAAPAA